MGYDIKPIELKMESNIKNSEFSPDIKKQLLESPLIILPATFTHGFQRGSFSSDISDFLKYLKASNPEMKVGIYENPGEEKFQELRADDIYLQTIYILITDIGLPIFTAWLIDFLQKRHVREKSSPNVIMELIVENRDKGITKSIRYNGPVNGLEKLPEIVKEEEP